MSPRRDAVATGAVSRSERVLPWAAAALGVAAAGVAATLWRPSAPPVDLGTATGLDDFGRDVLSAVQAYRRPRRVAAVASIAIGVAVPILVVTTRAGRRVVHRLAGDRGGTLRGGLVAGGLAVVVDLARLPVDIGVGYVHDSNWGFNTAPLPSWLRDWVVSHAVGWVVVAAAGTTLVWLWRRWPRSWPWRAALAGTGAAALLVLAGPALVEWLWLDTEPLDPGPTRTAVEDVLDRAGVTDATILVGDASRRTTRVNAYVSGLGPSRQVMLYDNLLELPPDRVGLVVAHELAHRRHNDLPRGVLATGAGLVAGVWVVAAATRDERLRRLVGAREPADPRLVAVAAATATVLSVVAMPVSNAVSRRAESSADQAALELTGDPVTAVDVFRTFVVRDLADPDPPGWTKAVFGTHPPPGARIRRAVDYARRHERGLPPAAAVTADEIGRRHDRIDG